jgi:hypothetical protein
MHFSAKMIESKNYHQKVALKSFPMNEYVSTILNFGGNFCVPPLVAEVTLSS